MEAQLGVPTSEGLQYEEPRYFVILLPTPPVSELRVFGAQLRTMICHLQDPFSVGLISFSEQLFHLCVPYLSLFFPEMEGNNLPAPPCFFPPGC